MMAAVNERYLIERLTAGMDRSPYQSNRLHESDAELLRIPGTSVTLAITTDGVVEEIASGLYSDPYLAGWMSIAASASDLAAVGANPLGILVSESLPTEMSRRDVARLQAGIRDAVRAHHLPVLGGDTNFSPTLQLTTTAIGVLPNGVALTRRGAQACDRLFASGPLGLGSAFALGQLSLTGTTSNPPVPFQPLARLDWGRFLTRWASACMDTSDGMIATVDELMRVNGVGISVELPAEAVLHDVALQTARLAGLPPWTMLAGPHGEFELLFTVPSDRCSDFRVAAAAMGWHPIELGAVVPGEGFVWRLDDAWTTVDTPRIRNLFGDVGGDPERFLSELLDSAAPCGDRPYS